MPQNMNVSVTLRFVDQLTQPLRQLQQNLQGLTRMAQDFNRAFAGSGSSSGLGRLQTQARSLNAEVRPLLQSVTQLGRAASGSSGGGLMQQQIASMRQLLSLQRQALQNSNQLASGGGGRGNTPHGANGFWGRPGFSPNASLVDRAQYRAVNLGEQSLMQGFLDLDRARTNLAMLANTRPDPNNPGSTLPGVISPQVVQQIEQEAVGLTQQFRALNRAHVLDTFKELVTQFQSPESAFQLLPQLLAVQEWQVLQGDTVEHAREGMARLVRAMGLSGRLVDNNGNLNEAESGSFLANYLRARMIGGVDVTPDQVFQVMKYLKASGQTMSQEALLTAFIGMPDIRGSTFGNQLNMLVRQLTGGATQAAQQAMAAAGLGSIPERTASGPHMFNPVDEVLLRDNPFEWFNQHILGQQGYLRRMDIDPMTANAAQISAALRPIFSNQSAENIANAIVQQQTEWRTQVQNALRFNLSPEALRDLGSQSGWYQMMAARSKLQDVMGSVAENFKVMLPYLEKITAKLGEIAAFMDPKIGNPFANLGILGTGAIAGFLTFRHAIAALGPWARLALGGGLGFLLGGPGGALMGGMILRQMGGAAAGAAGGAAAAAGAAGAAAGTFWGSRFLRAAGTFVKALPRLFFWGIVTDIGISLIENWQTVAQRIKDIWEDLRKARPAFLGGEGQGWSAIVGGQGFTGVAGDIKNYHDSWVDWIRQMVPQSWVEGPGFSAVRRIATERQLAAMGINMNALEQDSRARAMVPNVTTGPINVTVNVQTGADAKTIGEAAGSAVQSGLRGALTDSPANWPLP